MDLAFEATDKRGNYQKMIVLTVVMLPLTVLVVSAGFPYLTANPQILCKEKEEYSKNYHKCTLADICKNIENFDILKIEESSIHGWAYEYDLICNKSFYLALIGTCFFIGAIIGCLVLAPIPDRYGRLPVLKIILILNVFVQINFLFARSIQHIIVLCVLAGITSYSSSIMSLLITEMIDRQISGIIMSLRSASFGIVGVVLAFYFMYINDLKILFTFTLTASVLIMIMVNKYNVESPRWLNSKNRMTDCIEAFKKIAEINGTEENFKIFLEVNSDLLSGSANILSEVKKNHTIMDIFNYKSQRKKMLILCYIWFAITFCFYGLFTNLDHPGGNIFVESIITYSAEMFAELVSGFLAGIFGRIIVMKSLSFIGGLSFMGYFLIESKFLRSILIFISSFGFSGSLNILYIYTPETFPTSVRAMTFGFLFLVSRGAAVIIPIVSKLSTYTPILLGIMAIIAGLLTSHLEESLGKEMLDDIPEIKRSYSVLSNRKLSQQMLNRLSNSFKLSLKQIIVSEEYFRISPNSPRKRDSNARLFKLSPNFKFSYKSNVSL
jgi:MFS family permease